MSSLSDYQDRGGPLKHFLLREPVLALRLDVFKAMFSQSFYSDYEAPEYNCSLTFR
jgi:hypothetical protein